MVFWETFITYNAKMNVPKKITEKQTNCKPVYSCFWLKYPKYSTMSFLVNRNSHNKLQHLEFRISVLLWLVWDSAPSVVCTSVLFLIQFLWVYACALPCILFLPLGIWLLTVWIAFDAIMFTVPLNAILLCPSSIDLHRSCSATNGDICILMVSTTLELLLNASEYILNSMTFLQCVFVWSFANKWRIVIMCVFVRSKCTCEVVTELCNLCLITLYFVLCMLYTVYSVHLCIHRLASMEPNFYWMVAPLVAFSEYHQKHTKILAHIYIYIYFTIWMVRSLLFFFDSKTTQFGTFFT